MLIDRSSVEADRSLYAVGRAGLVQFVEALGDVISEDVEMTDAEAAGVPMLLFKAQERLLRTWDEICGARG